MKTVLAVKKQERRY